MIKRGLSRLRNTSERIARPSLAGYVGAKILAVKSSLVTALGGLAGVSLVTFAASSALVGVMGNKSSK